MQYKFIPAAFVFLALSTTSVSVVAASNHETAAEVKVASANSGSNSNKSTKTNYEFVTVSSASVNSKKGSDGLETEAKLDSNVLKTSDLMKSLPAIPKKAENYVLPYSGKITFGGGHWVYPQTSEAMYRAISSVGNAVRVCVDGTCYNKCDHIAGDIWGYEYASGYLSAATHWSAAKSQGIAQLKDREPPLGALLFWDTGRIFGHVATYIGNGLVVTNSGGEYGADIYIAYADAYETYGWNYLGWADPVFFNEKPGSALK